MDLKWKLGVWKGTSRSCHTRSFLSFISQIFTAQCTKIVRVYNDWWCVSNFLKQNDHVWSFHSIATPSQPRLGGTHTRGGQFLVCTDLTLCDVVRK